MMRAGRRKIAAVAMIAAFSLGGAAAAQAATAQAVQWNPQNTVEPITLVSGTQLVMRANTGVEVRCDVVNGNVQAPVGGNPAVAGTVDSSGAPAAPTITDCTNTLAPSAATATSTGSVDISQASATVTISGACTITVDNASVPANGWDNGTHQLTANSDSSFPINESGLLCDGATSATLSGTLQLPAEVTVS
jgi:hypothetical protein